MKRKRLYSLAAALLALTLLLTACGGGSQESVERAAPNTAADAVTVSSTEELLEAIAPGASISIAPGYYNMSDYIEELWATEGYDWNASHDYVQLDECFDGVEIVVQNVDGLSISGGTEDVTETELVVNPRYADVLKFQNCENVKLSTLTLGHTETGECAGSVVMLSACENVELRNVDLYGCGVIALECEAGTGNVSVYDSALRDCSFGPLSIDSGTGKFEFYDCALTGSAGGGYYGPGRATVSFYRCVFGEPETNYWAFLDDVYTEDCTWNEITEYPDYGYQDYEGEDIVFELDIDGLREIPFDESTYGESVWLGYRMTDAAGEEDVAPPSGELSNAYLYLREDGTGVLNAYYADRNIPFLWEREEDGDGLSLWTRESVFSLELYKPENEESYPVAWVALRMPEGVVWMY